MKHELNGGLKDAFEQYGRGREEGGDDAQNDERKDEMVGEDMHSIHHMNHGEMHSVHKIDHEGKAESSTHKAGEMGDSCPLCGASMGDEK